jgi:succinate dehydrogenase flavin-adding protein (antitoxin of CptAB toxin-antitoxin module)
MRELDILLERFLATGALHAEESQRAAFERLLEAPDPLLVEWLILGVEPPGELEEIVERVRADARAPPA